ncbi:penicillin acylase family protein [Halorarius litoreus]|uniref:penicillin acylase family protein n=1 Tax=Halorarius litoreus TaxID=2962676 RepID=UPI0020CD6883|nr:penicillin acylase family protein [Halorarius litoreus]
MERREFIQGLVGSAAATGLVGTASGRASGGANDPLEGIEILTDEYNESHIYADSLYALGYGNGYVQARDRLFQMDAIRHIGRGDSAEVLGPAQLPSDIQVRRDLYGPNALQEQWDRASETAREMIRGFADGVNRQITEMAAQGTLPGIFAALGHPPEPWEPTDTIACINYLIGIFGVSGGGELGNARKFLQLEQSLGSTAEAWEAYGDLNWLRTTDDHYTTIPPQDKVVEGGETAKAFDEVRADQLEFIRKADTIEPWGIETDIALPDALTEGQRQAFGIMEGFKWGSNALVVDGDHTDTGKPMLSGGPQMGYFKPPVPYEVGLHGAGFDCTGMGVVGAPAIVIGRTETLAWTVTSGRDDMVDTIAIELDPNDKHRYKWEGEWHTMETETVVHEASPVAPATGGNVETQVVEQEVARITQDGDEMPVIAWNPEENVAWVHRNTTRNGILAGAFQWAEIGRTNDLDEFEEQLSEFPFTFNFHVIEHEEEEGEQNIAYMHTGLVPDRNPEFDSRFPQVADGHYWSGVRTTQKVNPPASATDRPGTNDRNPSTGYYCNWNNGPVRGWRAGNGEQNWGSHHRVEVLVHYVEKRLAETGNNLSIDDMKDIMELAATHDSTANASIDHFIRAGRGADGTLAAMSDELQTWADAYCAWDDGNDEPFNGDAAEDARDDYIYAGVAIWEEVRREAQRLGFGDELGAFNYDPDWSPVSSRHADEHGNATDDVTFIDALNGETDYDWFGGSNRTSIREAMQAAADTLTERFDSPNPADWTRPEHKSVFTVIGAVQGEAIDMVNRSTYQHAVAIGEGLDVTGEALAAVSGDALPPSNSGHVSADELAGFLSGQMDEPERVDDQLELYASFDYKPHPITREQVASVAVSTQTLQTTPVAQNVPIEPGRDIPQRLIADRVPDVPTEPPESGASAPPAESAAADDPDDETEADDGLDVPELLGAGRDRLS